MKQTFFILHLLGLGLCLSACQRTYSVGPDFKSNKKDNRSISRYSNHDEAAYHKKVSEKTPAEKVFSYQEMGLNPWKSSYYSTKYKKRNELRYRTKEHPYREHGDLKLRVFK